METAARVASGDDLAVLARLAQDAVDELRPTRGGDIWSRREGRALPADDELARLLVDPDALVVAGCVDDTVVGYAVVRREVLRDGTAIAVIDDLYTTAAARGVAVGEAMMDLVVAWATARGCAGIDALALPGNRATKNFFETFGLVARAIVVHRPLGDPPADPAG